MTLRFIRRRFQGLGVGLGAGDGDGVGLGVGDGDGLGDGVTAPGEPGQNSVSGSAPDAATWAAFRKQSWSRLLRLTIVPTSGLNRHSVAQPAKSPPRAKPRKLGNPNAGPIPHAM